MIANIIQLVESSNKTTQNTQSMCICVIVRFSTIHSHLNVIFYLMSELLENSLCDHTQTLSYFNSYCIKSGIKK